MLKQMQISGLKVLINLMVLISIIFVINYLINDTLIFMGPYKLFECGFDAMYWVHPKLSVHFFKMGIIFVLFDLELMLLLICFSNNLILILALMLFIYWSIFIEFLLKGFKWTL